MLPAPGALLRPRPLLLGLAAITSAVLALEVLLTRLLSVLTWYSLAFLVIGMGLFGLTVGAVEVYLHPDRYGPERLAGSLADRAVESALAIPAAYAVLLIVPLRVESVATTAVLFLVFSALLAVPFGFAGAAVSAALTRSGLPIGRLYAVDLVGAAIGAPLVPAILQTLDAGSAIVLTGAMAAAASAAFASAGGDARRTRRGLWLAAGLTAAAIANGTTEHGLVPLWAKGMPEERTGIAYEKWNSHSRVQVTKEELVPATLWGQGVRCTPPQVRQRWLTIDGDRGTGAGTALYLVDDPTKLDFLMCDVTSLVHQIRPDGPAAVIGVGGSRDIQAALTSGHRPVVGVELNDRILEVLRGPYGADTKVASHPDVELVHDDGRSWMARTDRQFSVLQMSLIDTWAATGAGAHALGENGLYTVEAWRIFLSRLAPGGIFTVSRWFQGGSRDETTRLLALAVAALQDRGVKSPRAHIMLAQAGLVATLLVSRDPFVVDDAMHARTAAGTKGFRLVLAPGVPDGNEELGRILDAPNRAALDRLTLAPAFDLRPPVDDRPFFFNMLRVRAWLRSLPEDAGVIEGNRRATQALGLAFFSSLVLSLGAIGYPLFRRARPGGRAGPRLAGALAYFAAIGVAFMFVEIGLLQRLSLILGHPAFSLVVVLASLVASAGLGALASDRLPFGRLGGRVGLSIVLAALLLGAAWVVPAWAARIAPLGLSTRIGFAAALTAVLGFPMGMAFPAGMRTYAQELADETPWLWGVNGVAGVVASSGAVMIALERGIGALFVSAAGCYLALAPLTMIGAGSGGRGGDTTEFSRTPAWLGTALLVAAGLFVFLPALWTPYFLDDWAQRSMIDGTFPSHRSPFNLYDFIDAAERPLMAARGVFPWWSDPGFSMRFLRPLSSALLWAEHRLFGDAVLLFHLHAFLWWIAAALGARALFRRLLPPRAALLATVIFALAPCHTLPLSWIANRHVLTSLALGTWALVAYFRWRDRRGVGAAALALGLFALSLASGEYALCLGGYVLAREIAARGEPLGRRLRGLVLFAVPAAGCLAARALLGYGVRRSGFYSDPFLEPASFFGHAPRRIAILLLQGWLSLDHDTLQRETPSWVLVVLLLVAVLVILPPLLRLEGEHRATGRWLLLGSLLALVPVLSVICSPRLVGAAMLGIAANVALLVDRAWHPREGAAPASRGLGIATVGLCFAHFVHGPATSWLMAFFFSRSTTVAAGAMLDLQDRMERAQDAGVVIVRGLNASTILPWMDRRGPSAGPWKMLAHAGHVLAIRRDERTLELVTPAGESLFPRPGEANLLRPEGSAPMAAGDTFTVPGLQVTVLDVGPAGPRRARYEFDRDLDSPSLLWVSETFLGYRPVKLPAPGFGTSYDP